MVELRLELAEGCPKIAANKIMDLCGGTHPDQARSGRRMRLRCPRPSCSIMIRTSQRPLSWYTEPLGDQDRIRVTSALCEARHSSEAAERTAGLPGD
jgi:hypothetical protein